jgi:glycerol uptake facilitator-like aquaporin
MCQETFGTFIFVLFFKIVTDERLHFSKEPAINCFIIAASYVSARSIVNGTTFTISTYGACLNPAVAVGITLNSMMQTPGDSLKWFWLYWLLPFAGSLLAIVFYRFVYMKTQLMVMKDQQEDKVEDELKEEVEYDNTIVAEATAGLDE